MYKVLLMIRHGKKWGARWQLITYMNTRLFKGTEMRDNEYWQNYEPH